MPELRLHYTTVGPPSGEPVLIMHGTGGAGTGFLADRFAGELFGPGQPLDAARHYLILPDAIGHGKSSKPSDGLRAHFPHYDYYDMVNAQYRLVSEHLAVKHLRLVMGTSMGAMHTWIWGEKYPGFMDALMPLASAPVEIGGRNRMLRRTIIDAIRDDPEWMHGDYEKQPRGFYTAQFGALMMTSSPLAIHKEWPTREQADAEFDRRVADFANRSDANDMLYQFEASANYNPEPDLEKIEARLIAVNSADDEVNPPELGILEREIKRVKHGRYVLIPISDETRGHPTHSIAKLWKQYVAELLAAP